MSSMFDVPELQKLEDSETWQITSSLVEYMYSLLDEFPEEERWASVTKLRDASSDLLFAVAQALGDSSPAATEYTWSQARKYATGLKAIYRFAGRQKFIALDPDVMVKIDKLLLQIDGEVKQAYQRTKQMYIDEVEHWRKKYEPQKDKQT